MIASFLNSTPWLWPALALAISGSLVAFRPLARVLRAPRPVAFLLLLSLGGIVALTLTPGADAFLPYHYFQDCLVEVVRPIGFGRVLNLGERGLNVLLFIPFGAAIGALPWSKVKGGVLGASLVLPFAVEGIQYLVPALDRSCTTVDIIDNLTGLVIGLVIGVVVRLGLTLVGRAGGCGPTDEAEDRA
jgi:hypothetical protein